MLRLFLDYVTAIGAIATPVLVFGSNRRWVGDYKIGSNGGHTNWKRNYVTIEFVSTMKY